MPGGFEQKLVQFPARPEEHVEVPSKEVLGCRPTRSLKMPEETARIVFGNEHDPIRRQHTGTFSKAFNDVCACFPKTRADHVVQRIETHEQVDRFRRHWKSRGAGVNTQ